MAGIVDDPGAVLPRQFVNSNQVRRLPGKVNRNHSLDLLLLITLQRSGQLIRVDQGRLRVDVNELHRRTCKPGAVGRGHKGDGGRDHDIALADTQGQHGQMQGSRTVAAGHDIISAHRPGKRFFEGRNDRPLGQIIGFEDLHDRPDVLIGDVLPSIWQERLIGSGIHFHLDPPLLCYRSDENRPHARL